jgi:hypothetical protein
MTLVTIEAVRIGTAGRTNVLARPETVEVESGGRAFAWSPDQAERVAALLLKAAKSARAQRCTRHEAI